MVPDDNTSPQVVRVGNDEQSLVISVVPNGAVAQLAEHFHGMEGVRGSIPLSSTRSDAIEALAGGRRRVSWRVTGRREQNDGYTAAAIHEAPISRRPAWRITLLTPFTLAELLQEPSRGCQAAARADPAVRRDTICRLDRHVDDWVLGRVDT